NLRISPLAGRALPMSRRARPASGLIRRFGISGYPARSVRLDQVLRVDTESLADLEDGPELVLPGAPATSALVRSPGNLIQVASDRTQLTDGALEGDQLVLWQWRERSQVRSHEYG